MTLCTGIVPPLVTALLVVLPFMWAALSSPAVPPLSVPSPATASSTSPPVLGSTCAGLTVVLQASDIHLSVYHPDRFIRFESLVRDVIPAVRPSLVLLTGDITDANRGVMDRFRGQQVEEWEMYKRALRGGGEMMSLLPWLDLRGNHDGFSVPVATASSNLFNTYRRSTLHSPDVSPHGHYAFDLRRPAGTYRFVAVEAMVERAPDRHFFGELRSDAADALDDMLDSNPSSPADMTLLFGHYPACTVGTVHTRHDSDERETMSLVELMDRHGVVAYLSGHLHRLLGVGGGTLYARHHTGGLELELGDFKTNSLFRLMAIDGGVLSFADLKLGQWPLVLVTNPKDARFLSKHEPLENIAASTDIRVVAYARAGDSVQSVVISIDDGEPLPASRAPVDDLVEDSPWKDLGPPDNAPLWTLPWPVPPARLSPGLHTVSVEVTTAKGDSQTHSHQFSVDGTAASTQWFEQALMTNDLQVMLWTLVVTALLLTGGGMLLRPYLFWHSLRDAATEAGSDPDSAVCAWLTATYQREASSGADLRHYLMDQSLAPYVAFCQFRPRVFRAVSAFIPYLLIGPWLVGYIYNNQLGLQFGWGLWVPGTVLPHYDACIFFNLVLLFGVAPLIHVMGLTSARRHCVSVGLEHPGAASVAGVFMAVLISFELVTAVGPGTVFHGVMAMALSPVYTYFGVAAFVLAWTSVSMDCMGRCNRQSSSVVAEGKQE